MFVECDEIAVDATLWAAVKSGDADAKAELKRRLTGVVLYVHALSTPGEWECVSVREVCSALNDTLTLTIGFD